MISFLLISIIFLSASLGLYICQPPHLKKIKVMYIIGFSISILFLISYGIIHYITEAGITASVIYHLKFGLGSAGILERPFLVVLSILSLISVIILSAVLYKRQSIKKRPVYMEIILTSILMFLVLISLVTNPVSYAIYKEVHNLEDFVNDRPSKIYGYINQTKEYELENRIITFPQSSNFYNYYNNPSISSINNSKNLVFIYAESFERTFFNQNTFPNLTNNLREIESQSISFTNVVENELSSSLRYTMGGIVASQCGFPVVTPSYGNSMSGMDAYLRGTHCLGDLLKSEGYYLSFYGGADLNFAGKGDFLKTHGFDEIMGKNELSSILKDPTYNHRWGYYDDTLFNQTYKRYLELSKNKENFALFMLTLDTHHPSGYPSKSCSHIEDKNNDFLNSIACSDYLISEFINRIRSSKYSEDTVIVLVSDHLAIRNTASSLLNQNTRNNLFLVNLPNLNESKKVDSLGTTMDIAPTILPFIGYEAELGFGRDLINRNESDEEILEIHRNIYKFRSNLMSFWGFPKIEDFIEINLDRKKIFIDEREVQIPVLIEVNNNLETILKFDFDTPEKYSLASHINSSNNKNVFHLYVDSCENMVELSNSFEKTSGLCLFTGTQKKFDIEKINSNKILTANEIKLMIENS